MSLFYNIFLLNSIDKWNNWRELEDQIDKDIIWEIFNNPYGFINLQFVTIDHQFQLFDEEGNE